MRPVRLCLRLFPWVPLFFFALLAFLALAGPARGAGPVTPAVCAAAFAASPAASDGCMTLGRVYLTSAVSPKCYYTAWCRSFDGSGRLTYLRHSPDDARALVRCDGEASPPPCPARIYSAARCRGVFSQSPAFRTCRLTRVDVVSSGASPRCRLAARCPRDSAQVVEASVPFDDIARLSACTASLAVRCPPPPPPPPLSPDARCRAAFEAAPAHASCVLKWVAASRRDRCQLRARCLRADGTRALARLLTHRALVPKLVNCRGRLTVSCS